MKKLIELVVVAAAALSIQAHTATLDYFLKIDGVGGESTDDKHMGWVDVRTFSWGVTNSADVGGGGGGGGAGKNSFMPFGWTQGLDKSTVPVFLGVASGKIFSNVTFETVKAGKERQTFFSMSFDNVQFTSLRMGGGGFSIDVLGQLVYDKITMTYRPQKADGQLGDPITGSWDVKNNKQFSGDPQVLMGLFLAQPSGFDAGGLVVTVPEPQTWALMGLGLFAIALMRRRRGESA